jgi:hypothetical protein
VDELWTAIVDRLADLVAGASPGGVGAVSEGSASRCRRGVARRVGLPGHGGRCADAHAGEVAPSPDHPFDAPTSAGIPVSLSLAAFALQSAGAVGHDVMATLPPLS